VSWELWWIDSANLADTWNTREEARAELARWVAEDGPGVLDGFLLGALNEPCEAMTGRALLEFALSGPPRKEHA
jgi:hypothetical protein